VRLGERVVESRALVQFLFIQALLAGQDLSGFTTLLPQGFDLHREHGSPADGQPYVSSISFHRFASGWRNNERFWRSRMCNDRWGHSFDCTNAGSEMKNFTALGAVGVHAVSEAIVVVSFTDLPYASRAGVALQLLADARHFL
jgi:hypothetical protein